ncbi:ureidoglycolate lyase [Afipia sp. TerB]
MPAHRTLHAQPLSADLFAPFGSVIAIGNRTGRPVNQGRAQRIEGTRTLAHADGTRPVIDLYRVEASKLPFTVDCLERHPLSCQVFTPMRCARYLVIVAPADATGKPDLARALAFAGNQDQAICYGAGVWHAPMIALDDIAIMTMTMWEASDARDCEEFWLPAGEGLIVQA